MDLTPVGRSLPLAAVSVIPARVSRARRPGILRARQLFETHLADSLARLRCTPPSWRENDRAVSTSERSRFDISDEANQISKIVLLIIVHRAVAALLANRDPCVGNQVAHPFDISHAHSVETADCRVGTLIFLSSLHRSQSLNVPVITNSLGPCIVL